MRLPSPSSPVRASALFLILASLGGPAAAAAPTGPAVQGAFDPQTSALLLADANGDGDVAADEWAALLSELDPDGDGELVAREVIARIAFPDQDGDGAFTRADVEAALAPDAAPGLARFFLTALADANGDGSVSETELSSFLLTPEVAAEGDGALPLASRVAWVRAVEALPPPPDDDRGRRVPPVVLASLLPALDADSNGTLTIADLNGTHRGADANGDGVVTAAELANRSAPAFARWDVDPTRKAGPPLMPWQRTLEDALLLVERTGKPLLICVNMDDENASEVLAWNRYRDPDFARLASGFICVLASPDSREPLEYDDHGRRLPDRRFGRLLNSEHIDIEPKLYERYFREHRVAPRHVGVAPDGEILFDLYLLQNLSIIDGKLEEFGRPEIETTPIPATMSNAELLASPAAGCRAELERRFFAGDTERKLSLLLESFAPDSAVRHPQLARLALHDREPTVRHAGMMKLLAMPETLPLDLVPAMFGLLSETRGRDLVDGDDRIGLRRPEPLLEELQLVARLADQAGDEQRAQDARFLERVYATLDTPSAHLNPERWRVLLAGETPAPRVDYATLDQDAALAQLEHVEANLRDDEEDVALLARRATILAKVSRIRVAVGDNPLYFLQDTERAAEDWLERAPRDPDALALKAWALYRLNKLPESGEAALAALPHLATRASEPMTFEVLDVLASAKTSELYAAIEAGEAWDAAALPDARAAYEIVCAHPDATEEHWVRYLQMLGALRAFPAQRDVVRRALVAFPASDQLHTWLRFVELRDGGSDALEAAYRDGAFRDSGDALEATLTWYEGYALLAAAEHDVQCRDEAAARERYAKYGVAFQESLDLEPSFESTVAHYSALVLAGLARLQMSDGRAIDAMNSITTALKASPTSATQTDGLGNTPAGTARDLIEALERSGAPGQADAIRAAAVEAGVDL